VVVIMPLVMLVVHAMLIKLVKICAASNEKCACVLQWIWYTATA
jgi:hypothetical protein